jgi:hypothetical protein
MNDCSSILNEFSLVEKAGAVRIFRTRYIGWVPTNFDR